MFTLSAGPLVHGGRSILALLSRFFSRLSSRRVSDDVGDEAMAMYRLHCLASPYQDLMPNLDRELRLHRVRS